jgi:hypothetical protein
VKAGIRDRTVDYIVSENSWPLFLYEKYTVNYGNLEQGLFKSKILVQVSRLSNSGDRTDDYRVRLSKLYSHLPLLQERLMVTVTELTFSKTTGVPGDN